MTNCLTNKCRGLITQRRVTVDSIKEIIIDYVIITNDFLEDLVEVVIDEDKKYSLDWTGLAIRTVRQQDRWVE